jgi:Double-GTPase 2
MESLIIAGYAILTVVGVPIVAIAYVAARQAWRCVRLYVLTLAATLGIPDPATAVLAEPRHRSAAGQEPAFEHYLRRQAWRDLSAALVTALAAGQAEFRREWNRIQDRRMSEPRRFPAGPRRFILRAGLVPGTAVAIILLIVISAAQAAMGVALVLLGLVVIGLLRVAEAAVLRSRRVVMHCPTCFRPVSRPSYRCPACQAWHHRIRAGRYGLLRRRCGCGRMSLPTPLLMGSYRMPVYCPDHGCGVRLPELAGVIPETILPVLGGSGTGRTRLVTALVATLRDSDSTTGPGLTLAPADRVTAVRLRDLEDDVASGALTLPTPGEATRAYSFSMTGTARFRRLLHVLDTGGMVSLDDQADARQYLRVADTFLFVIDPLAIEPVWAALSPERQAELAAWRSARPPKDEFDAVTQKAQELGASLRTSRLAAVVTKADLLADVGLEAPADGNEPIERWLEDMGQDHLTRCMRHLFGHVRFFTTAAVDGEPWAESLASLARWLLTEPARGRRMGSGVG